MMKNRILAIFARSLLLSFMILLTLTSVISLQMQEAYADITSATINNIANTNSLGKDFEVDYTLAGIPSASDTISMIFTVTAGAGSTVTCTDMTTINADRDDVGAHTNTRTQLEACDGSNTFVNTATYTLTMPSAIAAGYTAPTPVTGLTFDDSIPTFTAAKTASNQITLTWDENIISSASAATAGNPFVLGGTSLTVSSTSIISSATSTQTLTLSSSIPDGSSITVSYDTDQSNGDIQDTADVDPNQVPDRNNVSVTGIPGAPKGGDLFDSPPSYTTSFAENEYPISIGDTKFKREQLAFAVPTTVIETGKPVQVIVLVYDDFGPTYIAQVELYTNINGHFRDVSHSDTHIVYKKGNPTTILDPNGFFSDVILSSSTVNQKFQLTYEITFAKEMEKSDIIIQARDAANNVGILTVSEAWQVIQAPTVAETTETPTDEPTDGSVPGEIKVKTLNVEKASYLKDEEILFFGTVDGYKFGTVVTIIINNPSNNFLALISTVPDKDSYFEAKTKLDSKFKTDGTYTATAFADDQNKGTQAIFYFSRDAPIPTDKRPVINLPL